MVVVVVREVPGRFNHLFMAVLQLKAVLHLRVMGTPQVSEEVTVWVALLVVKVGRLIVGIVALVVLVGIQMVVLEVSTETTMVDPERVVLLVELPITIKRMVALVVVQQLEMMVEVIIAMEMPAVVVTLVVVEQDIHTLVAVVVLTTQERIKAISPV